MKLGETVTYPSPEEMFLCGTVSMQPACAQWLPWERWIWSEHGSHLLPGCAGNLVRGGAEDAGTRARAMCELELLLCSVANTTLLQAGLGPSVLDQKPWGQMQAGFVPSKCALPPLPAKPPLPQGGSSAGARGAGAGPHCGPEHPLWKSQHTSKSSAQFLIHCLHECQHKMPSSHSYAVQGLSRLHPPEVCSLLHSSSLHLSGKLCQS